MKEVSSFFSNGYNGLYSMFYRVNPIVAVNKSIYEVPLFPKDIWNEVLSKSHSDLVAISCVSQSLNEWTKVYAEKITPEGCFGPTQWIKRKVDVKVVPKIPLKMIQDFDPLKWMLTLVLEEINGESLTLSSIDCFVSDCKNGKDAFKSNYRYPLSEYGIDDKTVKPFKAHWVMLSKDVLGGEDLENGTRNKTFEIQEKNVKEAGYEIPNLIDVVVSVFLHNLETGEFVYSDGSNGHEWTYARVQEVSSVGYRVSVGGFFALGLRVVNGYVDGYIGASCARKSLVIGH